MAKQLSKYNGNTQRMLNCEIAKLTEKAVLTEHAAALIMRVRHTFYGSLRLRQLGGLGTPEEGDVCFELVVLDFELLDALAEAVLLVEVAAAAAAALELLDLVEQLLDLGVLRVKVLRRLVLDLLRRVGEAERRDRLGRVAVGRADVGEEGKPPSVRMPLFSKKCHSGY